MPVHSQYPVWNSLRFPKSWSCISKALYWQIRIPLDPYVPRLLCHHGSTFSQPYVQKVQWFPEDYKAPICCYVSIAPCSHNPRWTEPCCPKPILLSDTSVVLFFIASCTMLSFSCKSLPSQNPQPWTCIPRALYSQSWMFLDPEPYIAIALHSKCPIYSEGLINL